MKYLFRGYIIMNWMEINFSSNKYTNYNRIINKYCMNYYISCQKYWKKIAQNPQVQKR